MKSGFGTSTGLKSGLGTSTGFGMDAGGFGMDAGGFGNDATGGGLSCVGGVILDGDGSPPPLPLPYNPLPNAPLPGTGRVCLAFCLDLGFWDLLLSDLTLPVAGDGGFDSIRAKGLVTDSMMPGNNKTGWLMRDLSRD